MSARIHASVFAGVLLSASGSFAQPAAAPAAASIKVGLWETTTISEDASSNSKHSVVGRTCIAAADTSNLARIVPAQREPGMQCEHRDIKHDGSTISWTVSCKSTDATLAGKGKISFFGDSYLGTADLDRRKQGGKPTKVMQSFSGKWLQACS